MGILLMVAKIIPEPPERLRRSKGNMSADVLFDKLMSVKVVQKPMKTNDFKPMKRTKPV